MFCWIIFNKFISGFRKAPFSQFGFIYVAFAVYSSSLTVIAVWSYMGGRIMILNAVLAGGIAMASLTIALFFLRFWKSTHDRFFLFFSISFALEAINRLLLLATALQDENQPLFYLIRLAAYVLILIAILEKNRRPSETPRRH